MSKIWFYIGIGIYLVLSLATLTTAPTVWVDEVMVVSVAHSFPAYPPDMDVVELSTGMRPYLFIWTYWLLMQPFLFVFGLTPVAARLLPLLAGFLTTILMRHILIRLAVRPSLATIISLLFLTDAAFALSVRGGRADTIALAWTFLAILLLVYASAAAHPQKWLILVGVCMTVSFASWTSSVLALLLVPVSLLWFPKMRVPRVLVRSVFWIAFAASVVLALLACLSLCPNIAERLASFAAPFSWAHARTASTLGELFQRIAVFYARQPWMILVWAGMIIMSLVFRSWRSVTSLGCALIALWVAASTDFHHARYTYILPALCFTLAFSSESLLRWLEQRRHRWGTIAYLGFLTVCLTGNGAIEPVARSVVALIQHEARDYGRVETFAREHIVAGDRVFGDFPIYYAVKHQGAHLIGMFRLVETTDTISLHADDTRTYRPDSLALAGLSGTQPIMDDRPATRAFLQSIDVIILPYDTVGVQELVSADNSVRFVQEATLPPVSHPLEHIIPSSGKGYSFVLFRKRD